MALNMADVRRKTSRLQWQSERDGEHVVALSPPVHCWRLLQPHQLWILCVYSYSVRICFYIRVEHVCCYKFLWRCHISVQGNAIKVIVVVAVGLLRKDLLLHWYRSKISCLHVGALTSYKLDNLVWYLAINNNKIQ